VRGGQLSHITGDTMRTALDGFSLKFADGSNYESLAVEVGDALARTIPPETLDPSRLSNADIRDKLAKLAQLATDLDKEISHLDAHSDNRLKSAAFQNGGFVNYIAFIFSDESEYLRFKAAASQLSFLADVLQSAARSTEHQAAKWRRSEQRRLRVWRGEVLIPIFESAFGKKITLNASPSDARHRAATPFMDFYQRMVELAFGEGKTADLPGVLKAARKSVNVRICDALLPGE
jgi:hypothetical protein